MALSEKLCEASGEKTSVISEFLLLQAFLNLTAAQKNTPEYPFGDKIVAREQRPLSNLLLELQLLKNIRTIRHGPANIIRVI